MATYAQLLNGTDKDALAAAGQAYNDAKARGDTAGMNAAHQQAEAIRANYGYSGGTNGSGSISTNYIGKNGTASMDYYNNLLTQLNAMYQSSLATNNSTYAAQLQEAMAKEQTQTASGVLEKYGLQRLAQTEFGIHLF